MLTPNRVAQLVKRHQAAGTLPADMILDTDAPPQPPPLPVEIRTSNGDLVEAAEFLRAELNGADDGSALLRKQLLRFDVRWQLLPSDAAELLALERWAETNCRPGWAFYRDEVSRQSYRVSSYEAQGEHTVEYEVDDTHQRFDEDGSLDLAA
jgi:hypothetical protein